MTVAVAAALAGCGSDAPGPADAAAMDAAAEAGATDERDEGDVAPASDDGALVAACSFVPGSAPAVTATAFRCATVAAPVPWGACPASFPVAAASRAALCGRAFPTGETPAAPVVRPDVVLGGTCGGQQVVVLEVLPGRGLECHYDAGGALLGLAFFSDNARAFCNGTSSAAAAGDVASAPCLLDMDASWDTVTCADVPAPSCGDGGAD